MQFSTTYRSNESKRNEARQRQKNPIESVQTKDKSIRGEGATSNTKKNAQNKNRCTLQHIRRLI